ncbi:HIRAN domain-containing protein [Glaciecola sp. KUL10]|uniref:HIRAN domain-containing protein n=1 Tax=Glaciecola sp. (strain KUL10) TaxID=2161813 RepID=UPI000D78B222|nr:HIRAN domain-containing protein [Glaciecola sp. KUL10]GBL05193.1 hiran domain protein [Glaciecola sp. KUL10]
MERRKVLKLLANSLPWLVTGKALAESAQHHKLKLEQQTNILESYIAGLPYYQSNEVVDELVNEASISLRREASNPHDKNAIEIFYKNTKLGYVPKVNNVASAKLLDDKRELSAFIIDADNSTYYREVKFAVYLLEG